MVRARIDHPRSRLTDISTNQSFPFQGVFYAIMAFSAKASEARPRQHDYQDIC